jgi:hypothetical protein
MNAKHPITTNRIGRIRLGRNRKNSIQRTAVPNAGKSLPYLFMKN